MFNAFEGQRTAEEYSEALKAKMKNELGGSDQ